MREQQVVARVAATASFGRQVRHKIAGALRLARVHPLGAMGLVVCVVVIFVAVFAPWVAPHKPNIADYTVRLQGPSARHLFGTDGYGQDLFSRMVYGARVSLYVAFFSIGIGTVFGYLVGIVSGYIGGRLDLFLQRLVDAMMAFPSILLALTLVAMLGAGLDKVIIAISIVFMPGASRVARGTVLSIKQNVYVDAARVVGASPLRIMLRHVLPNSLAPFLIIASAALGSAILTEASLSFLGLGVPPPTPSWGQMLSAGAQEFALLAPWVVIFPGLAIMLLVLGFNLLGDALRDVWDPKLRGR